jgi:hypothetical protein
MRTGIKIATAIAVIAALVFVIVNVSRPIPEPLDEPGAAPEGYEKYAEAVDFEFARTLASQLAELGDDPGLGFRSAGSPAEAKAAELLSQTMMDIGLENVTVDKAKTDGWTFGGASLTFSGEDGNSVVVRLGGYQTDLSTKGEDLPVVYLGKGTAADYEGVDVTGKLVLINVDQENEWWINYPAMQAHLKGARAVIACSLMEENIGSRIGSQDICGPPDAPAFAISADDSAVIRKAIENSGYESGGARQIVVTLKSDSVVTRDKGTQNIWGEIPGKTDDVIMFIAHYDGYYHSFYDDASGVGLVLGIAKAMRESDVKPDKTLRFVLHGAEEWGKAGTEADWATGAYEQIVNVRPEWAENTFALFNIDSAYPLEQMRSFTVNSPAELGSFVSSSISSFSGRGGLLITSSVSPPSTYREEFIYNASGVPTMAIEGGEGDEEYFASMYHSNMDSLEVGGYSESGALAISRYIGYSALMLDNMPLRPLNFTARLEQFYDTLHNADENLKSGVSSHLKANLERALITSKELDSFIFRFNSSYAEAESGAIASGAGDANAAVGDVAAEYEAMKSRAGEINEGIYKVYRRLQDNFLKLDRNLEADFANEGITKNIEMLEQAKYELEERNNAEAAIYDCLSEIESVYAATAFDKETCDTFSRGLDEGVKGTWAEGRLVSKYCDADEIVRSLMRKLDEQSYSGNGDSRGAYESTAGAIGTGAEQEDAGGEDYSAEVSLIDTLAKSQKAALTEIYNGQEDALATLIEGMNELLDTFGEAQEDRSQVF